MGVCPAGAKEQAVMPPGTFGGNMDTRQLTRGSTLYLPVQLPAGLQKNYQPIFLPVHDSASCDSCPDPDFHVFFTTDRLRAFLIYRKISRPESAEARVRRAGVSENAP